MSESFDTLWAAIGASESNDEKAKVFISTLEEVTGRTHIGMLCVFASLIQTYPQVDKALLAKIREIDGVDSDETKKMLDRGEFIEVIAMRLHPGTETYKWASKEREGPMWIASRSTT